MTVAITNVSITPFEYDSSTSHYIVANDHRLHNKTIYNKSDSLYFLENPPEYAGDNILEYRGHKIRTLFHIGNEAISPSCGIRVEVGQGEIVAMTNTR